VCDVFFESPLGYFFSVPICFRGRKVVRVGGKVCKGLCVRESVRVSVKLFVGFPVRRWSSLRKPPPPRRPHKHTQQTPQTIVLACECKIVCGV